MQKCYICDMKTSHFILLAVISAPLSVFAQSVPDWENPAVIGINKLPYHATLGNPSTHIWKGPGNSNGHLIRKAALLISFRPVMT